MTERDLADKKRAEVIVNQMTDYVNIFGSREKPFNAEMERQHRTLQQSFTRLCLGWIEHVASDEYITDGRNEQSHEVAKQLLDGFKALKATEGYEGRNLEQMSKPSGYLGLI